MNNKESNHKLERFPSHWPIVRFSEAFTDQTGGNNKIQQRDYLVNGLIPVIDQGQSTIAGYVNDQELRCLAKLPCILFGDHTKLIKYVEHQFALGADGVKVLVPSDRLDPKFAYYYLQQIKLPGNAGYSRHFKFLKENSIPLPPLPEQQRIAAILDKADAIRRKRQAALQLTEELLRSAFLEMFGDPVTNPKGWKIEPLGNHLSFLTSGSRGWAEHYAPSGPRFIRSLDVQMNHIADLDSVFVQPPVGAEAQRTKVREGDVLLTITGSRIGRVAPVTESIGEAYVSQHVAILRLTEKLQPRFVSMFLSDPRGGQHQIRTMQYGQTKPGLNLEQIRSFKVPCPPVEVQQRFLRFWDKFDAYCQTNAKSANQSDRLFHSLVQRAFRGEL